MERNYAKPSKCDLCINFVRLTQLEIEQIQPKINMLDDKKRPVLGACMRSLQDPKYLVREFIFEDQKKCELYQKGFHREKIGVPCPACKKGEIVINHPRINGKQWIFLGCSLFPRCRITIQEIPLHTLCRFCNTALMLSGGGILKCYCPKCQRSLEIPLSLRIWPGLLKPQGGCVHDETPSTCELCEASRSQRKNLLDLELPAYLEWYQRVKEGKIPISVLRTKTLNQDMDWEEESLLEEGIQEEEFFQEMEAETLESYEDYKNFINDYWYLLYEEDDGNRFE